MTEPSSPSTTRVIAATDYSEHGNHAVEEAIRYVRGLRAGELHIVHVIDDMSGTWPSLAADAREVAARKEREELHRFAARLLVALAPPSLEDGQVAIHVRVGPPANQIARLAADLEADLIVMGTHGRRGMPRLLLGSVAEKLVRIAPCSVMVVREAERPVEEVMPEPPCPKCLARRFETRGERWWCDEHDKHHGRPHAYAHTSFLQPRPSLSFGQ